ncbi:hypothetical protein CXF85_04250 [Colwellia sp. 75C3]|uniref:hypothetical protein n=1 Tax=Colwellia sp. 75C3 TaxID=888425 RepID=UPI000C34D624|nr:hypothetical protein [Colwellia sp. 75C3]PKG85989.1 hypothetical protein CXF85_04250 [Colwellia sp. 75C3]
MYDILFYSIAALGYLTGLISIYVRTKVKTEAKVITEISAKLSKIEELIEIENRMLDSKQKAELNLWSAKKLLEKTEEFYDLINGNVFENHYVKYTDQLFMVESKISKDESIDKIEVIDLVENEKYVEFSTPEFVDKCKLIFELYLVDYAEKELIKDYATWYTNCKNVSIKIRLRKTAYYVDVHKKELCDHIINHISESSDSTNSERETIEESQKKLVKGMRKLIKNIRTNKKYRNI